MYPGAWSNLSLRPRKVVTSCDCSLAWITVLTLREQQVITMLSDHCCRMWSALLGSQHGLSFLHVPMDLQITLLKEDIVANNQAGTPALCSTWEASNIQQPRGSLAAVPTLPRPGRLVPVPLVAVMLQGFPPSPLPTGKNGLARSSSSQSINLHHSASLYRIYSTGSPLPSLCTGTWHPIPFGVLGTGKLLRRKGLQNTCLRQ